jgi:hypothetical protein
MCWNDSAFVNNLQPVVRASMSAPGGWFNPPANSPIQPNLNTTIPSNQGQTGQTPPPSNPESPPGQTATPQSPYSTMLPQQSISEMARSLIGQNRYRPGMGYANPGPNYQSLYDILYSRYYGNQGSY